MLWLITDRRQGRPINELIYPTRGEAIDAAVEEIHAGRWGADVDGDAIVILGDGALVTVLPAQETRPADSGLTVRRMHLAEDGEGPF